MLFPSVEWWPQGPWGAFWLFMVPVGPVKTAGILVGKNAGLGFFALLGIYLLKDLAMALYVEPLLRLVVRLGPRYAWSRSLGAQIDGLARRTHLGSGPLAQVGSLAMVAVGAGFLTGAAALPSAQVARPLGWLGVIAGDVAWFCVLLAASLGLLSVVPDDRIVFGVVVVLAMASRPLTRRLTAPALPATPRAAE
jgi:hypothetical protein